MKLVRTAKIKLNIVTGEALPTMQAYTKAFNFVCQAGFDKKCFNGVTLHKLVYANTREYLPSQLAISARMKATEALKSVLKRTAKKKKKKTLLKKEAVKAPHSRLCSIRLDKNSYTLFLKTEEVSILTIDGRKRYTLNVPKYYSEFFRTWKNTSADLCLSKGQVYLHIVFEKDISETEETGKLLGIDRGINNLAVTSDNKFYGGSKVKQICRKRSRLRQTLQKKGTKSAKRHLARLSGKERRFKADINHCISKEIIASLNPGDKIILEDLSGIRNKRMKKPQRIMINNWNFFQLELFLIYKGLEKGIKVEYVDPRYTSQRCSKCGFIDRKNRKSTSSFECKKCNFKHNADLNAAKNICLKYLESQRLSDRANVNKPIVSSELPSVILTGASLTP